MRDEREPAVPSAARVDPVLSRSADALPRVIESGDLLRGAVQLAILHRETVYFLRETRFGRLILTK